MDEVESNSTRTGRSIAKFFVPASGQIILYILTGVILLALINIQAIWSYFNSTSTQKASLDLLFQGKAEKLGELISWVSQQQWILQAFFWALVGIAAYLIIWIVSNLITNVRNDIVAGQYVHPSSYSNTRYWESVIANKIFLIGSMVIIVAYVVLCLKYVLPLMSESFYTAILNFRPYDSTLELIGSIFGTAFMLYALVLIAKVVINIWSYIYKGS